MRSAARWTPRGLGAYARPVGTPHHESRGVTLRYRRPSLAPLLALAFASGCFGGDGASGGTSGGGAPTFDQACRSGCDAQAASGCDAATSVAECLDDCQRVRASYPECVEVTTQFYACLGRATLICTSNDGEPGIDPAPRDCEAEVDAFAECLVEAIGLAGTGGDRQLAQPTAGSAATP